MDDSPEGPEAEGDVRRSVDEYIGSVQPPPEEVLDLEFVYEALAHPRRRYIVYSLLSDTRWTLDGLATKLVSWEQDVPEGHVTKNDHDEMYVSLFHAHVPNLVALDIVRFEIGDKEKIVADENAKQVLAVLESAGASLDTAQEIHARKELDEE